MTSIRSHRVGRAHALTLTGGPALTTTLPDGWWRDA